MIDQFGSAVRGVIVSALAVFITNTAAVLARQNQTPSAPQQQGQPAPAGNQSPATPRNQSPAAPGNQTPAAPAPPPLSVPLYVSPGVVQQIQQKLLALGYAVPSVSGAWGDTSSAALAQFQQKNGLDPGGDLDELTLGALGMGQVLQGELPDGGDAPVTAQAAATGGAPFHASPRLTRLVQNTLTDAGHPPDNVFGVWLAGSETAVRNFQKTKSLDITGTLDLRLIHVLGLTASLAEPKPGKLPTDSVAQVLSAKAVAFTGAPISIGPAGLKQIQSALQRRGHKEIVVDGKWSDSLSASLKKFQEGQQLEATGSVNLRTLKALGFASPLMVVDQAAPVIGKPGK